MTPSDRIHEALMRFKAQQILNEAQKRNSVTVEPHPVIILEENLMALSSNGVSVRSESAADTAAADVSPLPVSQPEIRNGDDFRPPRTYRRAYAQRCAEAVGIAAVVAILASAAPFSPPLRKLSVRPDSSQGPDTDKLAQHAASSIHLTAVSSAIRTPITSPGQRRHASLNILETTWVAACTDGRQVFAELLTAKSTRDLWFSSHAVVRVGNASGVEIAVDGVAVGPLGEHGRLRRIEISPTGFRVLPLKSSDGDRDCWND